MISHSQKLEALLFVAGEPVKKSTLLKLLEIDAEELERVADTLTHDLSGRGLSLLSTDTELELRACAESFEIIKEFRELELSGDIGRASLETLAIVLYKKGATRKEIDWIRGVNSSTALRTLLLRGLIEKKDYDADKRLAYYIPTMDALAHLGATSIEDLPRYEEFARELTLKGEQNSAPPVEAQSV